jgi:hypothetical protein
MSFRHAGSARVTGQIIYPERPAFGEDAADKSVLDRHWSHASALFARDPRGDEDGNPACFIEDEKRSIASADEPARLVDDVLEHRFHVQFADDFKSGVVKREEFTVALGQTSLRPIHHTENRFGKEECANQDDAGEKQIPEPALKEIRRDNLAYQLDESEEGQRRQDSKSLEPSQFLCRPGIIHALPPTWPIIRRLARCADDLKREKPDRLRRR